MENVSKNNSDIPLPVTIVLLFTLVCVIFYRSLSPILADMEKLDGLARENGLIIGLYILSIFVNIIWFFLVPVRKIGFRKQGSRLEQLEGENSWLSRETLFRNGFGALFGLSAYFLLNEADYDIDFIGPRYSSYLTKILFCSIGMNAFIAGRIIYRLTTIKWAAIFRARSLSTFPKEKNEIILGSENEDSKRKEEPGWVKLNRKALNGNIFITGSIGSGKTQGTILPYLDQILENFHPTPSILAIDPKGTFIKEAVTIIKKHGLSENCIHLRLGGPVTFNPIYEKEALRSAKYLDVARMIRGAASNFTGGAKELPFWEMSSFNLIKNCLVYCAAVHGYYTLNHLYDLLTKTVDEDVCSDLESILNAGKFDEEEAFNIDRAIQYFSSEYKSLDPKVKTSILATSTAFLNQFQEYQASKIFCPPKDGLTLGSMADAVEHGKIILFDINNPGLAKSMGTFVKLHYQKALLERLKIVGKTPERPGVLIIDEYQDVATVGNGSGFGDDGFVAKGREGNTITIVATQSVTSLSNSLGSQDSAREIFQNFRTRIALNSSDLTTIKIFQELAGDEEKEKTSRSISELSQDTRRNYLLREFDVKSANITESVSKSLQKEKAINGKDFSELNSFEALAQVYDGYSTKFKKLFLKPYFLSEKRTPHKKILKMLASTALMLAMVVSISPENGFSFPTVCDIVKSPYFQSCLEFNQSGCTCGGIIPHPCARFTYYVPETYIEVVAHPKETFFKGLPGAEIQLGGISRRLPSATEDDDGTEVFEGHTIPVPYASIPFNTLPCRSNFQNMTCFGGMSEHFGDHWMNGIGDLKQPEFLAWQASPKACLLKGAAMSIIGGGEAVYHSGSPTCSFNMPSAKILPPSPHSACNGWGVFYPRMGRTVGPMQTTGALMIASRIKSLSSEVLQSTPTFPDERWQMIKPQTTQCFREGENVGSLELLKSVSDIGRLQGGPIRGHLFAVWRKVSCCVEMYEVPAARAALAALQSICSGQLK